MRTINVRELRTLMPVLKETLAQGHELLLVSNGEPVARILPVLRKRQAPSLAAHRAKMAMVGVPSEVLLRRTRLALNPREHLRRYQRAGTSATCTSPPRRPSTTSSPAATTRSYSVR